MPSDKSLRKPLFDMETVFEVEVSMKGIPGISPG
jgi:hypothetical protein